MLDLRRLALLRELRERGTIAAVAGALRYTPSAVSQQLATLERETGVALLERAGRGVRLTDAALVLVEHAEALLARAAQAEADLAAAGEAVGGRARIAAFRSAALELVLPAMAALRERAPRLRCELVEAEPEQALPALALGDLDVVVADEWDHQPLRLPRRVARLDLFHDPVLLVLPAGHPAAAGETVALADLAGERWATGDAGLGWDEMTRRTCRALGGFEPDVAHRVADAGPAVALAAQGLAVALVPALFLAGAGAPRPGVAVRRPAGGAGGRTVLAVTRADDAARPSTRAVLDALAEAASRSPSPAS